MTGAPMWDAEQVATLKRLWTEGLSASQIKAKLGGAFSRSAICGKARRLGLERRTASEPGAVSAPRVVRLPVECRSAPPPKPKPPPIPSLSIARPWTTREFGECAYPVAGRGADTLSCCAPTEGSVYCAAHHRVMYYRGEDHDSRARQRDLMRMANRYA